jgi:hypothetical protein
VSTALVGFEDLDMYDAKDKIQHKENGGDGDIGYDLWRPAETLVTRGVWGTRRLEEGQSTYLMK